MQLSVVLVLLVSVIAIGASAVAISAVRRLRSGATRDSLVDAHDLGRDTVLVLHALWTVACVVARIVTAIALAIATVLGICAWAAFGTRGKGG